MYSDCQGKSLANAVVEKFTRFIFASASKVFILRAVKPACKRQPGLWRLKIVQIYFALVSATHGNMISIAVLSYTYLFPAICLENIGIPACVETRHASLQHR